MAIINKSLKFGILLIILITPVYLWFGGSSFPVRFSSLSASINNLGQILGLLGMTLFSLTLILNTRLKPLEIIFGGLNKVFPIHHFLGKITFILLLSHPLALSVKYLNQSVKDAVIFFLPGANWAVNFGIFALMVLIVLLFITFFVSLPYNRWLISHRFLGIAFILAIFHVFSVDSDVYFNQPLRIYIALTTGAGLSAYIYRTIFPKILVKKYKFFIDKVNLLNSEVVELVLTPQNEKLVFSPGQFAFLEFTKYVPEEQHPFSITSSPKEDKLKFTVKMLGDFTKQLKNTPKNTPVEIEGPYGIFGKTENPLRDQVWIAGGIGLTPFLSMARSFGKKFPKVDFYYSTKNKQEAVFIDEFTDMSKENNNFRVFPWFTTSKGRLDINTVAEKSNNILLKEIFICGPIPMIDSFRSQLLKIGVSKTQIHSEEFRLI